MTSARAPFTPHAEITDDAQLCTRPGRCECRDKTPEDRVRCEHLRLWGDVRKSLPHHRREGQDAMRDE